MIMLAVMAYYALFFTRGIQQTGDSLGYAISIKTGEGLFHPHHLLYNPLVRPFYLILSAISTSCDAILAAQLHNILWAILAVVATYIVINHLYQSRRGGILAGLCLLLTRGFWGYTTQVEVYVPATACLIILASHIITQKSLLMKKTDQIYMAIIFCMAVFFHQTNVLFCIPLAFYLYAEHGKPGLKIWLNMMIFSFIIVASVYVLAFVISTGTWRLKWFIRFLFSYTKFRNPEWGQFSHFGPEGIRQLLGSQASTITVWPGTLAVTLAGSVIMIWHAVQIWKKNRYYKIRLFLIIWLAVYYLFFLWWLPSDNEFFIVTLVPIILLLFIFIFDLLHIKYWTIGTRQDIAIFILTLIFCFFTFVNIFHVLRYHRTIGRDYLEAGRLVNITPSNGVILSTFSVYQHIRYYYDYNNTLILPHQYFYYHQPLSEKHRKLQNEIITLSMEYVQPGYTLGGMNGYTHPGEWMEWLNWLFKFHYDDNGHPVSCREFGTFASRENAYLMIRPVQMPVKGLEDLFDMLDNTVQTLGREDTTPFMSWLRLHASSVSVRTPAAGKDH